MEDMDDQSTVGRWIAIKAYYSQHRISGYRMPGMPEPVHQVGGYSLPNIPIIITIQTKANTTTQLPSIITTT